jgi:NAD(P)-dependent dehydrogenase (short-subunit alcohol dehydrogenase family)
MEIITVNGANSQPFRFFWKREIDLKEKVIVAFGGLGNLSETFLYAASVCGARIIIADLRPDDPDRRSAFMQKAERLARNIADLSSHGAPEILSADVTDDGEVEAVFRHVGNHLGAADVVIDFAGIHHPSYDLCRDDAQEMVDSFRKVLDINLTGAFIVTLQAARHMIPRRKGHIIHLCSSGSRLSLYGSYAYNASKHGLEGLVKTAAAQLAPFGVRVNGMAPGTVITDLNRDLIFNPDGSYRPRGLSILAHTPSKRFITAEGVAETLLTMCVDQRHFTGNLVFADDGYNIEGHSWPDGNRSLFAGKRELEVLFTKLDELYPKADSPEEEPQ